MQALLLASALLLAPEDPGHHGVISGTVVHSKTKEPIPNALVILQCSCLRGARETQTNANGLYAFRGLPAGTYTIQVLAGTADVSKVVTLPPRARWERVQHGAPEALEDVVSGDPGWVDVNRGLDLIRD